MLTEYDAQQYALDRVRHEVQAEQLAGWTRVDAIVAVAERYGIDPFKLRDVL